MANFKTLILEKVKSKAIKYEVGSLEKKLMIAYGQGDFKEVEKITNRIMELNNKQMDNLINKMDQNLVANEKQIDDALGMITDFNASLGLNLTPSEHQYVQTAVKVTPLSKEEEIEAEKLLEEIMKQGNKKM